MNYTRLLEIYSNLRKVLTDNQFRFRVIGGQASIQYRLSEFTKDLDIGIEPRSHTALLALLNQFTEDNSTISYRVGLGAPLDERWATNGWTSHFEIVLSDAKARIDIFTVLPRVDKSIAFREGISDLHILAETKKTQRAKDWDIVRNIALLMIEKGDLRGFLHLFDRDALVRLAEQGVMPTAEIIRLRPSLSLISTSPETLDGALTVERTFWQMWDKFRIQRYLEVGKSYYKSALADKARMAGLPLMEQHQILLQHAGTHLPADPFAGATVQALVNRIIADIFAIFPRSFEAYLPNIKLIVHDDGVYNVL